MRLPNHIGIIPDGNRRWAASKELSKEKGYEAGIDPGLALFKCCEQAGIKELTYYGFTTDNTKRPARQRTAFTNACIESVKVLSKENADLLVVGNSDSPMFPEELLPYTNRKDINKFGSSAGLLSALFLAVTPVFVAVSRNNTFDNLLILVLLLACLTLTKAFENGKMKYLFIGLALVGVGFNIKMLQAYMIIPAIYISYFLYSGVSFRKRIINLIIGSLILAAVSLSWAISVDLVPKANRPYVGSSSNNTVMELIFGHNGIERLTSTTGNGGAPGLGGKQNGGGMGSTFGGNETASIFRLNRVINVVEIFNMKNMTIFIFAIVTVLMKYLASSSNRQVRTNYDGAFVFKMNSA